MMNITTLRWLTTAAATLTLLACGDMPREDIYTGDPRIDTPTWEGEIQPLLDKRCVSCHRDDAWPIPGEDPYDYQSCEVAYYALQTVESLRLLPPGPPFGGEPGEAYETIFESETMPPGGAERLTSIELVQLENWIEAPQNCP